MLRVFAPCAAAGLALALVACNEAAAMPWGPQASGAGPAVILAQAGGGSCAGEINRYQAIIQDDLATGNLEQKVYDQIQRELAQASAACAAGRGGEAHSIVVSSKNKHGYRA